METVHEVYAHLAATVVRGERFRASASHSTSACIDLSKKAFTCTGDETLQS